MGVNCTPRFLDTRNPMNAETQRAATDSMRQKARAAPQGLLGEALLNKEYEELGAAEMNSTGSQSQSIVKWLDPCQGLPSTGYQNAAEKLLASPILNCASCSL